MQFSFLWGEYGGKSVEKGGDSDVRIFIMNFAPLNLEIIAKFALGNKKRIAMACAKAT